MRALALALVAVLLPQPVWAERLPDGLEVVVVPVQGAPTVSLRLLVRAGSADDPRGLSGLAHVVEHAIFQGARGTSEAALQDATRSAGARFNALTSARATVFSLDTSREAFPSLAALFLGVITNPSLEKVNLSRELGVVATEEETNPTRGTLLDLVETAVFLVRDDRSVIGTLGSRAELDLNQVIAFYQAHYQPGNAVLVVAGDVTPESVRALAERSVRWPPSLPGEPRRTAAPAPRPALPFETKFRSRHSAAIEGYQVEVQDQDACEELAELARLRLSLALEVREPMAQKVEVVCADLSGTPFLLAFAFSRGIAGSRTSEVLAETLEGLAARPVRRDELSAVGQRLQRRQAIQRQRPEVLAESEVQRALQGQRPSASDVAPARDARQITALMARTLVAGRRIRLTLSPFDG